MYRFRGELAAEEVTTDYLIICSCIQINSVQWVGGLRHFFQGCFSINSAMATPREINFRFG